MQASGQSTRLASDTLLHSGDYLKLRHLPVVPGSAMILHSDGSTLYPDSADWFHGKIYLPPQHSDSGPIIISYRYFNRFLSPRVALRTLLQRTDTSDKVWYEIIRTPEYQDNMADFFDLKTLQKTGSITRGLTVGNNQNASLTSGLRLQLEGDIGDGVQLVASITDENIPIQPDGTTQQINDFDRVFIQLKKDRSSLTLGDFEVSHQHTLFANFYRNVQGINARYEQDNMFVSGSLSAAKGRFHTNSITGKDGVQGPYRLTGRNNERFIIILAGSEKVYVNGELMTRGENNDYVMDYNTGELTFTAQRLITSASRIVIDFEYSDRYYNRSLMFGQWGQDLLNNSLNIRFSYGRDADNPDAPIDATFGTTERDTLRNIGDDRTRAFSSGLDSVGYDAVAIRYLRRDTTVSGISYERYVFSSDPDSAVYDIQFSFVGSGNGYYKLSQSTINGSVYVWVPPGAGGQPAGDYAPVKLLSLPTMLQVSDIKLVWMPVRKIQIYSETALSSEDRNRLSAIDDEDNQDIAHKTGIKADSLMLSDSLKLHVDISQRYVGVRYRNIDRVYNVEYGREWNFNDLGQRQTERITEGTAELNWKNKLLLTVNPGIRTGGTSLNSTKQRYELVSFADQYLAGKWTHIRLHTTDDSLGTNSDWIRHNADLYHRMGKIVLGSELWTEDKTTRQGDSLLTGSFRFQDVKPYIKTTGTKSWNLIAWYNFRNEEEHYQGKWYHKSMAHTENLKVTWNPKPTILLQNTTTYRNFRIMDSLFSARGLSNVRALINNLQTTAGTKNKLIFSTFLYEVTSEQLARRQVAFIEVNSGLGQYVWSDINEDGIEQLDEFQIAINPLQANYVRVLVPTRELFPTTTLNMAGTLQCNFRNVIKEPGWVGSRLLKQTSTFTTFRVSQKKESGTELDNFIIDPGKIFADTTLLEAQYNLRQELYFFRNNPKGELRFMYADSKNKLFLTTGSELRGQEYYGTGVRINWGKDKSIEQEFRTGSKFSNVTLLDSRNYNITFREWTPKVNWQIKRTLRLSLGYELKIRNNRPGPDSLGTDVTLNKGNLELRLNLKKKNNIITTFSIVRVDQMGTMPSFSADYELKDGLKTGTNLLLNTLLTFYPTPILEFSLQYDGRLSPDTPMVHTGRVQLRAFF